MDRREKPQLLNPDFVREMEVSICKVSSSFKGFLENGCMSLRKGRSFSIKGNPVKTFVICLNSATKAKQDKSQGQKLSKSLENSTASPEKDVFKNIGLGRAKRQ